MRGWGEPYPVLFWIFFVICKAHYCHMCLQGVRIVPEHRRWLHQHCSGGLHRRYLGGGEPAEEVGTTEQPVRADGAHVQDELHDGVLHRRKCRRLVLND